VDGKKISTPGRLTVVVASPRSGVAIRGDRRRMTFSGSRCQPSAPRDDAGFKSRFHVGLIRCLPKNETIAGDLEKGKEMSPAFAELGLYATLASWP